MAGALAFFRHYRAEFDSPKRLFQVGLVPGIVQGHTPLAVTADGSRIVFPFVRDSSGANLIHIATPMFN
jgi:hypothetical protein